MNWIDIAIGGAYLAVALAFIRFATRPRRRARRIDAVAAERAARYAPAIETVPGFDRQALDICNAILNGPKGDQP